MTHITIHIFPKDIQDRIQDSNNEGRPWQYISKFWNFDIWKSVIEQDQTDKKQKVDGRLCQIQQAHINRPIKWKGPIEIANDHFPKHGKDQRESKQALQGKTDQEAKESPPDNTTLFFHPITLVIGFLEVGNALREDPQSRNNRETQ